MKEVFLKGMNKMNGVGCNEAVVASEFEDRSAVDGRIETGCNWM
jgi:hypothetical protein